MAIGSRSIWYKIIICMGFVVAAFTLGLLAVFFHWLALPIVLGICFFIFAIRLILKDPFYGIVLIAFFLPFERLGTLEVASFTLKINHIFGLAMLVAWLLQMLIQKSFRFKRMAIFIPLFVFFLINLLSFTQAINIFRATTVFLFILFAALIGLAVANLTTDKEKLEKIIKFILISALLVSLFGIFQFVGDLIGLPESITGLRDLYTKKIFGFPRIHSTALEPLYFANYLLIPLSLALALLLSKGSRIRWYWLALILIIGLINFALALSRAAYLALFLVFLAIFFTYFKNIFSFKRILIFILVLILVFFIFTRIFNLTGDYTYFFSIFVNQATDLFSGASYYDRAETYEQALALFKAHPWLGIGIGNFGPQVAWYPLIQPEKGWLIVNNEFLEILAETGIFALISFFIFLAWLFFRSIKAIRRAGDEFLKAVMISLTAAFIGIIVQYQTFSTLYIIHIWFVFGLMLAVQNLIFAEAKKSDKMKT